MNNLVENIELLKLDLLDILKEQSLTEDENKTLKGIIEVSKKLDNTIKDNLLDINLIIEILSRYESTFDKETQEDFDSYCKKAICLDYLFVKNISVGDLVVSDSLPYVVSEIDYEDCSIFLSDSSLDNGFWESIENITK